MKILSLNLWRYYDWENRFENIVNSILEKEPDVIFLQEVQLDKEKSLFSQVEILKKELGEYKYSIFSTIVIKTHQRGKELKNPIQHGMAILSKYPIVDPFVFYCIRKGWAKAQPYKTKNYIFIFFSFSNIPRPL